MSFLGKKWIIHNQKMGLGVIEKLHENRDLITDEKKQLFFADDLGKQFDPFIFKGMKKAVERIKSAIANKEKIMVFGDYDVDGITATVILYDFLKKVGADVHHTLPGREKDGYGLKDYFIRQFKKDGIQLIITVDCGTANLKEVELANELGIEVIITDHHDIPEKLPPAFAIINSKQTDCDYPNKDISGSGVAYKIVSALAPYYFDGNQSASYLYQQLGVAVLGLVSDCMPLTGENRLLAKHGLKSLESSEHKGINALIESAGAAKKRITSVTIGYYLGPRINAAGRLDDPNHAFELLLGDIEKVSTLNKLNIQRQKVVEEFMNEAKDEMEKMPSVPHLIILSKPHWRVGTLGLIAGKLCDCFMRPAIAMQERENEYVASCRSLGDFDITSFLRKEASDLFSTFGGHKLAGGFSLPKANFKEFVERIDKIIHKYINPDDFFHALEIDCEIAPHELTFDISKQISQLEPFGNGNPEPTLMIKNIKITGIKPVGKNGEHIQFPVKLGDKKFQAIAFRFGEHIAKINPESSYDIAFNLEINEWNGYKNLQLKVVDFKQNNE